jgi:hypothetical protein
MRTCFIAAVVALAAGSASAGIVTFGSDAAFNAYETAGSFTKQFAANVRWGNGTASGDWEYAIVDANDMPIGAVAQTPWSGTNDHVVTFTFAGGNAGLDLSSIGNLSRTVNATPTSLFARVRDSVADFSYLSNIQVDLAYNGVGVDYSYNILTGDPNAEYWGIEDANLQFGFTLIADASLIGPRSSGSDPMYQFKVGIPTPGALALLGLAGIVAGRRR